MNTNKFFEKGYCANVWIYYAKKNHWKKNAIVGVMSYMLQENLQHLGCGTYEAYPYVTGPCNTTSCKMLNNAKWKKWIDTKCSKVMHDIYYGKYPDGPYAAFGIGLLADSNVWSAQNVIKYDTANRLLNEAIKQKKYWQDPNFQMPYYFKKVFSQPSAWDLPNVNPVTDDRSDEMWCRLITAGYGMPSWNWNDQTPGMLDHVRHLPEARQIYANYPPNFKPDGGDYGKPYKPRLNSSGMQGSKYWYSENPLHLAGYGLPNCTCYAWGRFWEICEYYGNKEKPKLSILDATVWFGYTQDGYERSQTPQLGAVACFKGGTGATAGLGHVSIVEEIKENGDIITSNSAYGGQYFFTLPLSASNHYYDSYGNLTCQGFIINPCVEDGGGPLPPEPEESSTFKWWMYLYPF